MHPTSIPLFDYEQAKPYWQLLLKTTPLIHCLTNPVAINLTANVLLAAGASPAMITAPQEIERFTPQAANVLINVGTLHEAMLDSMRKAAQMANQHDKPWVLDPVAVGNVLTYRTEFVKELLDYAPSVIRGNAAEILHLAGEKAQLRGADSVSSSAQALDSAILLAKRQACVVVVTGECDYITDGERIYHTRGGDVRQTRVTACGCVLSALTAAFVAQDSPLPAAAAACAVMKRAGDYAGATDAGMGTFAQRLLDGLSWETMNRECH